MIKKILPFLLLFASITYAQHTIKGFMSPKIESDWVIIYKIEGTKQAFVNNTTLKTDSLSIGGVNQAVRSFEIKLPSSAKSGSYRATYRLEGAGFVDFFYNKEDISFIFNPDYPQESIAFTESSENILYSNYINQSSNAQQKLDSIQVAVLQNNNLNLKDDYQKAYINFKAIQTQFEKEGVNKYVEPFIKASPRKNSEKLITSVDDYLFQMKNTFFDRLDFSNEKLINSSFLTNRILDYIFYINYSDDLKEQQELYKTSIETVLSKIKSDAYKRDIIQFIIEQFEASKNLEIIDYLFENHYSKLPISIQDQKFKEEKMALFATEVGRIAPDFSWQENGKTLKLSTLNDAENYVLVFWSTSCSHCLREIPELHTYMANKPNIKVIAFALENDAFVWETYQKTNLSGWHNVLGLKKWENKTARTYQINSTPSYFVLDKKKQIIAKPNEIKDVKDFLDKM
ncbi:MAG: thioredoxin-like domain-containing protein [Polaribacter sp.]|uniref:TlpA family protein disulfide reductase n=1 Tax=Polaribacter sp. TaxID=1920175 RepID=UPI003BAE7B95